VARNVMTIIDLKHSPQVTDDLGTNFTIEKAL
jgi:hypothetical protein